MNNAGDIKERVIACAGRIHLCFAEAQLHTCMWVFFFVALTEIEGAPVPAMAWKNGHG